MYVSLLLASMTWCSGFYDLRIVSRLLAVNIDFVCLILKFLMSDRLSCISCFDRSICRDYLSNDARQGQRC